MRKLAKRKIRERAMVNARFKLQYLIDENISCDLSNGIYYDHVTIWKWAEMLKVNKETAQWCLSQLSKEGLLYPARTDRFSKGTQGYDIRRK